MIVNKPDWHCDICGLKITKDSGIPMKCSTNHMCTEKEGYLVMSTYSSDEIHYGLVNKEQWDKIKAHWDAAPGSGDKTWNAWQDKLDELAQENIIYSHMTMTNCVDHWPFRDTKIHGTVHIWAL